jgi:integrase
MTQYQLALDLEMPVDECRAAPGNPFLDAHVRTFADVIECVRNDQTLRSQRRYDYVSSLRAFAKLMRRDPAVMPAMPAEYRRAVRRLTPAGCGLSSKRIANIKSGVLYCMGRYGTLRRRTAMPPIGVNWQPVWQRLGNYETWILSRFVRWCSASGRRPSCITDTDIVAFHADLTESFADDPNDLTQGVCRLWNRLRDREPDLDLPQLTVPVYRKVYCQPISSFPESFQRDLEAFCRRLAGDDPFAEDAPPRPLRPETIKLRHFHVRQLASALVNVGYSIDSITSLATLVEPANLVASLTFFLDRAGGKVTAQIYNLAGTAKVIAKHWVHADGPTMARISSIVARVRFDQVGMTQKNMDRLRQFDDDINLARLLFFAEDCLDELRRTDDGGIPAACLAQVAIAVDLLLAAPIRIANLATLRLDTHILHSRSTERGIWHLVIPAEETKNSQRVEHILSPEIVDRLKEYLKVYRPRLALPGNDHLFPAGAGHTSTTILSKRISAKIHARTGLAMHPHLFRHLAAKLTLSHTPGTYGIVQDVLGHRNPKTTRRFYAGEETAAAMRHFETVVGEARARLRSMDRKR